MAFRAPLLVPTPRPTTGAYHPATVHAGPGVGVHKVEVAGGHKGGVSPSQPDLQQKRKKTGFP